MVRYMLPNNSGSTQALRHHHQHAAGQASVLNRKFSSFESDISTLSSVGCLIGSSSVTGGGAPFSSLTTHSVGSESSSSSSRESSSSSSPSGSACDSGLIARSCCKNCCFVFLCAYSPSGPDFCSMDCRTSFDLLTTEEETMGAAPPPPPPPPPPHTHYNGDYSYSHQQGPYYHQQQPEVWDEPPAHYYQPEAGYVGYGSASSVSNKAHGYHAGNSGRDGCYYYPSSAGREGGGGAGYSFGGGLSLRQAAAATLQWRQQQQQQA